MKLISIIIKGERVRRKNEIKYNTAIPPVCVLSVTQKCNLTCKGCYANNKLSKEELTEKEIKKIIREAFDLGMYIFVITGGEPLIVKNLLSILNKYSNAIILIFTNGLIINDDIIRLIKKNRHIIPVISYEGSERYNDDRRGKENGQMIENALKLLQHSKIIYGFSTTVFSGNVYYISSKSYFDKMNSHGADFGFFIDYIPNNNSSDNSMILSADDIIFKNNELEKRRNDSDLIFFNLPVDEEISGSCWAAGKGLIHINAAGDVEPCMFYHFSEDNIRNRPLIDIIKSDFFKKMREQINEADSESSLCKMKQLLIDKQEMSKEEIFTFAERSCSSVGRAADS